MRLRAGYGAATSGVGFPFQFGGAFIEAKEALEEHAAQLQFPFQFGGAFIEAAHMRARETAAA